MYSSILRPLLFSLPPETAHHAGLAGLKLLGLPGVRSVVHACASAADPVLKTSVAGIDFPSPVGLGAGFDKDAQAVPGLSALGFGFLEVGTVTPRPQPGNPRPRIFRVPEAGALVNRLGFNNGGAAAAAGRLRAARRAVPVGVNIGKNKDTPNERAVDDYLSCLETFAGLADFFVVNVSSPNTPGLRGLQAPSELEPLMKALTVRRDALCPATPLFVKISPDEDFGEAAADLALKHRFAGIVATNTTRSRQGLPADAPSDGGMSGRPLFAASTAWVRRVHRIMKGKGAVIGVGGVFSARDAYEKVLAGASLVEVYTGFVYNGPGFARSLNSGLSEMLRRDGFASVQDAVGRNA